MIKKTPIITVSGKKLVNEWDDWKKKLRFKVVEVGSKTKTVNRADPTLISKVVSTKIISQHVTKEEAAGRIDKLIDQRQLQYDMDHSWGAPPECFTNMTHYEWYIIDTKNNQWYSTWMHPISGKTRFSKIDKIKEGGWQM